MDSEPLPDYWAALNLEKDADTEQVKKAHRKLVLHCHPDKIKPDDPSKDEKLAKFHLVQKAYEVLIDPQEKATWEAKRQLEKMRREGLGRNGASSSNRDKTARFDVRTAGGSAAFHTTAPPRYATEERRPSRAFDEDEKYYDDRDRDRDRERARASTRSRYDTYPVSPKTGSSPRMDKESSRAAKATTERSRAERTKARDEEKRRERKFVSVDSESSSADEKARHEAGYKKRTQEDEARRAAESRRKGDERRSYEDTRYGTSSSARKMSTQENEAIRYQHKSRAQVEEVVRPSPVRASSRDYYGESSRSSRRDGRPEPVRRSSARPKERTSSSGRDKDRGYPEIVGWGEEDSSRRPPAFTSSKSSPANIEIPRAMPQRSYTAAEPSRDHRKSTSPPAPSFHRSQTMPTAPHSASRSKPATVSRPSNLRESVTPEHVTAEGFPSVPPPQSAGSAKTKYYHYPTSGGGVPLRSEDISTGGHRTILREPERQRKHSPEPLSRPPMGPNRPSEANISKTAVPRQSSSRNVSPVREERGRSSRPPLYGEINSGSYVRPRPQRQNSFNPNDVHFAPRYGPDDVKWASRNRENERGGEYLPNKPTLGRTATYAY